MAGENPKPAFASLRKKSSARLAAVQCLYQIALNESELEPTLAAFTEHLEESARNQDKMLMPEIVPHRGLMEDIVRGVHANHQSIDDFIAKSLITGWTMDRMSPLLLSILRGAVYELQHHPGLKTNIIIDEYVTLTRGFFSDPELGFVNAFLNAVAKTLRPA